MNIIHLVSAAIICSMISWAHLHELSLKVANFEEMDQFCERKCYQDIRSFSQPELYKYIIFSRNNSDHFYVGTFNGTTFSSPPTGPYDLTKSFVGMHSFTQHPSMESGNNFMFVLFVEPKQSRAALQFIGDQVYYWTGPNNITAVQWPANCPKFVGNIINRSIQPHVVFDEKNYYYNLTIDRGTGSLNCSERSEKRSFSEPMEAVMGVDAPLSKYGNDPQVLTSTRLFKWNLNGYLCFSHMSVPEATYEDCGQAERLPNKWHLFACPDPNQRNNSGRIVLIVLGVLAGIILLAVIVYYLATRIFDAKKNEIKFGSQIE